MDLPDKDDVQAAAELVRQARPIFTQVAAGFQALLAKIRLGQARSEDIPNKLEEQLGILAQLPARQRMVAKALLLLIEYRGTSSRLRVKIDKTLELMNDVDDPNFPDWFWSQQRRYVYGFETDWVSLENAIIGTRGSDVLDGLVGLSDQAKRFKQAFSEIRSILSMDRPDLDEFRHSLERAKTAVLRIEHLLSQEVRTFVTDLGFGDI